MNGLDEFRAVENVEVGGSSYSLGSAGVMQGGAVALAYKAAVEGTTAANTLTGGATRDLIFARGGDDTVSGLGGDDLLHGGDGKDSLTGDLGNDQLLGESGNDTLIGSAGNDTLSGGVGSDVFRFSSGSGQDIITDFNMGAGDHDVIQFAAGEFASAHTARLAAVQSGDDVLITHASGATIRLVHVAVSDLTDGNFLAA